MSIEIEVKSPTPAVIVVETVTPEGITVTPTGPKGERGEKGERGDTGATFVHTQIQASTEWVIQHNLDRMPSVTVVDSSGSVVYGDIIYDSMNQVTVRLNVLISGEAYFN